MMERIESCLKNLMIALFIVALCLSLVAEMLRNVSTFDLVVAGALVSCTAYFIRKQRIPRENRPRSGSGGERTPAMPHTNS